MTVQQEKFKLIEWLVKVQDPRILEALIRFRKKAEIEEYEASLKPMTKEELTARAVASNKAIENGDVYNIESILDEDWDNL